MLSFPNLGTIFTKWEQLIHPVYVWCEDQAIDLREVDADVDVVMAAVKNCL